MFLKIQTRLDENLKFPRFLGILDLECNSNIQDFTSSVRALLFEMEVLIYSLISKHDKF